jgi:hypothetical protein
VKSARTIDPNLPVVQPQPEWNQWSQRGERMARVSGMVQDEVVPDTQPAGN